MRIKIILSVILLTIPIVAEAVPRHIAARGEKVIIVDPRTHTFGAYNARGQLVHSGVASSGRNYCPDIRRACRTKAGYFRIYTMGDSGCYSSRYPLPHGGAPMPYCMYFNGNQALHGSYEVARANLSHGCVRLRVNDARWLRYQFAEPGTLVIVKPY